MAGAKEKSGGKREGAGRKASPSSVRSGSQIRITNETKELLLKCEGKTFDEKILKLIEQSETGSRA